MTENRSTMNFLNGVHRSSTVRLNHGTFVRSIANTIGRSVEETVNLLTNLFHGTLNLAIKLGLLVFLLPHIIKFFNSVFDVLIIGLQ